MSKRPVKTAMSLNTSRYVNRDEVRGYCQAMEASGVVDQLTVYDQPTSWLPDALWTPDVTPLANALPDLDSAGAPLEMCAYASAVAPSVGTAVSIDATRRGPVEMFQSMLTLSNLTQGNSTFMIGAGEKKQFEPFGWKRREGLKRFEDSFKIWQLLWENEGPINFEGNIWNLQNAWIGDAKPYRPRIYGLGGGPKLMDITTSYADGFSTMNPITGPLVDTPERFAETVIKVKQELERKGRDPEEFDFSVWALTLMHDDEGLVEAAVENPLIKFYAAYGGRLDQKDWREFGIDPVFPDDWHYASGRGWGKEMKPDSYWWLWSREQCDEVVRRTSHEMSEKSWMLGTPEKIAAECQDYVDAGANHIIICDIMSHLLPMEEQLGVVERCLRVCGDLKGKKVKTPTTVA